MIADDGRFDGRTRKPIALAVPNIDECSYCQAAHTAGDKLAALLTLAREMTANKGTVADASWKGRWTQAGPTQSSPS